VFNYCTMSCLVLLGKLNYLTVTLSCSRNVFLKPCICPHVYAHICGHVPDFLKLVSKKCACVFACLYACMYICSFFCTPVSKPLWHKNSLYTRNKGIQSLYYTYTQVSFGLEMGFFSKLKTQCANSPQTSSLAFLVDFSGVL